MVRYPVRKRQMTKATRKKQLARKVEVQFQFENADNATKKRIKELGPFGKAPLISM